MKESDKHFDLLNVSTGIMNSATLLTNNMFIKNTTVEQHLKRRKKKMDSATKPVKAKKTISKIVVTKIVKSILLVEVVLFIFSVLKKYSELVGDENVLEPLLQHSFGLLLLILLVVFFTTVSVYFYLHESIVVPIKKIFNANRLIAVGDHTKGKIVPLTGDEPLEINEIVKSRNEMLTHLEDMRIAADIAFEKIKQQKEDLIAAGKLKEDVERITRHDLKTPLTAIIGVPDLLLMDENLTEKQKKLLRMVQTSGYNMLHMINRSLDLFKMENGTYKYVPDNVNVIKVVGKIIDETRTIFQKKNVTVVLILGEKTPVIDDTFLVQGEELLCYSLLSNLIKNAIEASPNGKCVTVSFKDTAPGEIRIHNSGVIPEGIRGTFFEKYVIAGKKEGTGLGTYSAKLITETQGGTINFDTSENAGTTIMVKLIASSRTESGILT